MSKVFPEIPTGQNIQVKSVQLNKNIEKYLGEFNGKLTGTNMPVSALTNAELSALTVPEDDYSSGDITKESSRGPTQAYYASHIASWEISDIWTPVSSIDLKTESWKRGWNRLDSFSTYTNLPLEFTAREGMLVGCATIDWHHGVNRVDTNTEPGATIFTNYSWWTEWGVFVNNVLVARSDKIYPRRHTTQLPFSVPVGSQAVRIDVRFITSTGRIATVTADPSTALDIFGVELWARNHYR